jgi:hypothetical protein
MDNDRDAVPPAGIRLVMSLIILSPRSRIRVGVFFLAMKRKTAHCITAMEPCRLVRLAQEGHPIRSVGLGIQGGEHSRQSHINGIALKLRRRISRLA